MKLEGMELQKSNIKKLVDNHLVARWFPAEGAQTEGFIVTTENLINFINDNFTWKRNGIEKVHDLLNK